MRTARIAEANVLHGEPRRVYCTDSRGECTARGAEARGGNGPDSRVKSFGLRLVLVP